MAGDGRVEVYRVHADKCVQLAQRAADSETRLALLEMARAWQMLAEQGTKNRRTTLVYETPERPQQFAQPQQQPQPDDTDKKE